VFQAAVFTPQSDYVKEHPEVKKATYNVVVLAQTTLPEAIPEVHASDEYRALVGALEQKAKTMNIMPARNIKHVGAVDRTKQGLFAFNYFVGDDAQTAKDLLGLLRRLVPGEGLPDQLGAPRPVRGEQSAYVVINSARWKYTMPARFLSKPSFWTYVRPNLDAHHVGLMPIAHLPDRQPNSLRAQEARR
jgi:hypothetical protein